MADEVTIDCGDALGIADVAALYTQLLNGLLKGQLIQFDCSRIDRIDTAALQLLYAFSKAQKVSWVNASPRFITASHLLGLADEMGLSEVAEQRRDL